MTPPPAHDAAAIAEIARQVLEGERRIRNDYRHSSRVTVETAVRAMVAFASLAQSKGEE